MGKRAALITRSLGQVANATPGQERRDPRSWRLCLKPLLQVALRIAYKDGQPRGTLVLGMISYGNEKGYWKLHQIESPHMRLYGTNFIA